MRIMETNVVEPKLHCRYFISYSGVQLPLNLVNELDEEGLQNRITYFRAFYDDEDYLKILEKVVYGEIEFIHHYEYHANGAISKAILIEDEDELPRILNFDRDGNAMEVQG